MKSVKYLLLAVLVTCLFITCKNINDLVTTGLINGFVSDTLGSPISGAQIRITPGNQQVQANDSGYYEIPDIPAGIYTVTAAMAAFIPACDTAVIDSGRVTTVNFKLKQSQRNVVGEMLTTACHCGDVPRTTAYGLIDTHGGRFIYLECHASRDPMFDTWDPFADSGSESRRLFYLDTFLIGAVLNLDGSNQLLSSAGYATTLDSLLNVPSSLTMQLTGSYSSSSQTGNLEVEITAVDAIIFNDLQVLFAVYERGPIPFSPSGDTVSFRNVLINLMTPENLTIAQGETKQVSKVFSVPDTIGLPLPPFHVIDVTNIGAAVFVQSQKTKRVLQAASVEF